MARHAPVITVAGAVLDPARVALPLTISHGRTSITTQPDAPTASFTWVDSTVPFQLGDSMVVTLDLPVSGTHRTWGDANANWASLNIGWGGSEIAQVPRFTGTISAIQAVEVEGVVESWSIGAVGVQAALGSVNLDLSRPAETDHARVQAIAAAAGFPLTVLGATTTQLLADNIFKDALSALHEVCEWTAGLLFQGRDGTMFYGAPDHRSGQAQGVIPSGATLDGVQWDQGTTGLVNHLVVTFGDPQTQNTYRDDDSIAHWGFRHEEVTTKLASETEANVFGQTIIIRRSQPYWSMPGVVVNSIDCTDAEYWQINSFGVGTGVLLPVPTEPGPIGTQTTWTVEGWQEVWDDPTIQRLQFALSDRERWGAYVLRLWSGMDDHDYAYWVPYSWLQALSDTQ